MDPSGLLTEYGILAKRGVQLTMMVQSIVATAFMFRAMSKDTDEVAWRPTRGKVHAQGSDFKDAGTGVSAPFESPASYPGYAAHALLEALRAALNPEQDQNRERAFVEAHAFVSANTHPFGLGIHAPQERSFPKNIKREASRMSGRCRTNVDCRVDFSLYSGVVW
jgi:hypothetical protein